MHKAEILLVLALFISTAFAEDFGADYESTVPDWYFRTDMRMTTDFRLSLVSGGVESGDPTNLRSGDTVCSGAVVRVTPTMNSKWAISRLSIRSAYPTCEATYCPAMISYSGGPSLNKDIKWLTPSIYDDNFDQGDRFGFTNLASRHDQLATFYTQPVTYTNSTGVDYPNKEGGANIFCKGNFQITDGSTVVRETELPATSSADITLATSGSHEISTRLSGVDCFAALEKHPIDLPSHPEMFRIYYFTHAGPAISPSAAARRSITLNVGGAAANCTMHESSVDSGGSSLSDAFIRLKVNMCNDGPSPIRVMRVESSNPAYTVSAFPPPALCRAMGFGLCPDSNGFNQDINSGSCRDLYVLVTHGPGASGDLTLTFSAEGVASGCGGVSPCAHPVLINDHDIYSCRINPSSVTPTLGYGPYELLDFRVTCYNLAGHEIPCVGDNWFWADGLTGGFWERDNRHAAAYPTSPFGSMGTLRYRTGHTECWSSIQLVSSESDLHYECEFVPASATVDANESEDFVLECTHDGVPATPDEAGYRLDGGLCGTLSNESTSGVTYTACDTNSSGDLVGAGLFRTSSPDYPIIGAIARAPITVRGGPGTGTGNDTNATSGGPRGPGSSEWCSIDGFDLPTFFPGYYGWITLGCGPTGTGPCSGVVWPPDGADGGVLVGSTSAGTYLHVTIASGMGRISAYVDGDAHHSCYKDFFVGPASCLDIS